MKHLIIPNAIAELAKNPKAIKFTNKEAFEQVLDKQRYFSASQAHCFYSETDYALFHKGDARFRDGNAAISEANRGCTLLFEVGRELVAVWSERDNEGYIVPSKNQKP